MSFMWHSIHDVMNGKSIIIIKWCNSTWEFLMYNDEQRLFWCYENNESWEQNSFPRILNSSIFLYNLCQSVTWNNQNQDWNVIIVIQCLIVLWNNLPHHHHHHLFLKRLWPSRSARVRRFSRYEASPHIPEHCQFRMQTKLLHIILYSLSPGLPASALTPHPCHLHTSTGRHPIIPTPTLHMPKPPQSTMPHNELLELLTIKHYFDNFGVGVMVRNIALHLRWTSKFKIIGLFVNCNDIQSFLILL